MPISALGALWVVPALPLLGFLVNGALALWRPTAKTAVSLVGVSVLVLACAAAVAAVAGFAGLHPAAPLVFRYRSEERRVGKECRAWPAARHQSTAGGQRQVSNDAARIC